MGTQDILKIGDISESQVPDIIRNRFQGLKELKEKVSEAQLRAETAQSSAQRASYKSAGFFGKREAIESLQSATVDIADAQISAADAQKLAFQYQEKLGELTKYLFGLGVSNIAMNRSVVRELELKLRGASEEELDDLARKEVLTVVKQLKAQEDMMKRQSDLTARVKAHDKELKAQKERGDQHEQRLQDQETHERQQDSLLKAHSEKDREHDALIAGNKEKTIEHDRRLAEKDRVDKSQDEEIARQAAVDEVLKQQIADGEQRDKMQDSELTRLAEENAALWEAVHSLTQAKAEHAGQLDDLRRAVDTLTARAEQGEALLEQAKTALAEQMEQKADKKAAVAAGLLGLAGLILALVHFFAG